MISAEVKGLAELERRLNALPLELQRQALRPSLKAGVAILEEEVKANAASVKSLPEAIESRLVVDPGIGGEASGKVFPNRKKAWWAHFFEFGTHAHVIEIKKKKVLAAADHRAVFGRKVQHPGLHARPFMRPALDARWRDALSAFASELRRRLDLIARRQARTKA